MHLKGRNNIRIINKDKRSNKTARIINKLNMITSNKLTFSKDSLNLEIGGHSPFSIDPTIFNHKHLRYPSREGAKRYTNRNYTLINIEEIKPKQKSPSKQQ